MRIMAYLGTLVFLVLRGRRVPLLARQARAHALVPVGRVLDDPAPVPRGARRLGADRGRAPAVDRGGPLKTADASSPSVSTATIASSLGIFVALYGALVVVDFVLMRRYARLDPPEVGGDGDECASRR